MSTDKKTQTWYEENAKSYAEHVRNPEDSLYHAYYEKPAMYGLLPDLKGKTVLSLGCGSGEDSNYLKQQGAEESIGIDLSKGLILIAEESYRDCKFYVMDMEKLDFEDKSFDFVYSSLAIHYLEDWTAVLKEVNRVLKPGSHFLFSCAHPVRTAMVSENTGNEQITELEIRKDTLTRKRRIKGDYVHARKISNIFGKDSVNTWHHSFESISEAAYAAGFTIERIVSPVPNDQMRVLKPEVCKQLDKVPEFVIFKLLKL